MSYSYTRGIQKDDVNRVSIDWLKEEITGKSHISWKNRWFPVDFPLSQRPAALRPRAPGRPGRLRGAAETSARPRGVPGRKQRGAGRGCDAMWGFSRMGEFYGRCHRICIYFTYIYISIYIYIYVFVCICICIFMCIRLYVFVYVYVYVYLCVYVYMYLYM